MNNNTFEENMEISRSHDEEIDKIIRKECSECLTDIQRSSLKEDLRGIDANIYIKERTARRIFQYGQWDRWHEHIIRYINSRGNPSSDYLSLKNYEIDAYFVGWANNKNRMEDYWMLLDGKKVADNLDKMTMAPKRFPDGSLGFKVNVVKFARYGCILNCSDKVRDYIFMNGE
jgi:hypothetical protein